MLRKQRIGKLQYGRKTRRNRSRSKNQKNMAFLAVAAEEGAENSHE